jgi:hypothetical protein
MGMLAVRQLRARLGDVLVLACIAALFFGGSLAAVAGARRSSTALDRFLAFSRAEDVYLTPPDDGSLDIDAVVGLREVAAAAYQSYVALVPMGDDGAPDVEATGSINPYLYTPVAGPADVIRRRRVVRGRDLDPKAADEAVVDEELASARHLRPGDHLSMAAFAAEQLESLFAGPDIPAPEGPVLDLTITGIVRLPADVHPDGDSADMTYGGTQDLYLSPALYAESGRELAVFAPPEPGGPIGLLLHDGPRGLPDLERAVRALPGGDQAVIERGGSDALDAARTARRAIAVETMSLLALAVACAIAGLTLVVHGVARLARAAWPELEVLRALGLRPRELAAVAALPGVVAGAAGALGAAVVAVSCSPLTPIGLGRLAEIDPGGHADVPVLGVGALAVVVLAATGALGAGWLAVRSPRRAGAALHRRPSRWADVIAQVGAPLGATLGARFATEPPGGRRAPLRYAAGATALALLAVAGVGTYASSLDHLVHDRAEQGATWDLVLGNPNGSEFTPSDAGDLAADRRLSGVSAVISPGGRAMVGGSEVAIAGLDLIEGAVGPRTTVGRLPTAAGEVVLGTRTADRLDAEPGDRVEVRVNATTAVLTVVGVAVLNPGLAFTMEIGDGAVVTTAQLQELLPGAPVNLFLARVAPGVTIDTAMASLRERYTNVARPAPAVEVINLRRVRVLPVSLAVAMAVAAVGLLAVAAWTSAADRRRDLFVLRALGAARRQVAATLVWQGIWLYAVALLGLPLGVAAGRLVWQEVARRIGTPAPSEIPLAQLVAVALLGGLVSVALARLGALRAGRPAHLRVE